MPVRIVLAAAALCACAQAPSTPPAAGAGFERPPPAQAVETPDLAPAAAPPEPDGDGHAAILDALWRAAESLPEHKRASLAQPMLALVARSPEAARLSEWEARLGETQRPEPAALVYDDHEQAALALLREDGEAVLLARAREGARPFNIGRPETLGALAAKTDNPAFADRIFALMFDLAAAEDSRAGFGAPALAHAAAEAAMLRCDAGVFERALPATDAPESVRYAFWRARLTGEQAGLAAAVREGADASDTSHVRQAMDGYRTLLDHGVCKPG